MGKEKTEDQVIHYTPSIEEFHVGFEYEVKVASSETLDLSVIKTIGWLKLKWDSLSTMKNLFTTYSDGNEITSTEVPDSIRVKYLDRGDVESEGWVLKGSHGKGYGIVQHHYQDKKEHYNLMLMQYPDYAPFYKVCIQAPSEWVFKGIIKNKSEFKQIIHQLQIPTS